MDLNFQNHTPSTLSTALLVLMLCSKTKMHRLRCEELYFSLPLAYSSLIFRDWLAARALPDEHGNDSNNEGAPAEGE